MRTSIHIKRTLLSRRNAGSLLALLLAVGLSVLALLAAEALVSGGSPAHAQTAPPQTYTLTDLSNLTGSDLDSQATDINSSGQVVGTILDGDFYQHAFLYDETQSPPMKDLGTPVGYVRAEAWAINDSGQVAVKALEEDNYTHAAYLYDETQQETPWIRIGGRAEPYDINSSGQVVGMMQDDIGDYYAFLYDSNNGMQDLNSLIPEDSGWTGLEHAWAINDKGQIVGDGHIPGYQHAFLYDETQSPPTIEDLGTPAGYDNAGAQAINDSGQVVVNASDMDDIHHAAYIYDTKAQSGDPWIPLGLTEAYDINSRGQVVGMMRDETGVDHVVLYENGEMKDLNSLIAQDSGWTLKVATAINDDGQIVGIGFKTGNLDVTRAFLLTPPPVIYDFSGFFAPVDNPGPDNNVYNTVKAGSAIPVKFSLGGDQGLDIFYAGYPASQQIPKVAGVDTDAIEQTVSAGQSGLSYNQLTGQYTYVWKTEKGWAKQDRELILKLADGKEYTALFRFTK